MRSAAAIPADRRTQPSAALPRLRHDGALLTRSSGTGLGPGIVVLAVDLALGQPREVGGSTRGGQASSGSCGGVEHPAPNW
jgi:hypothetical protein